MFKRLLLISTVFVTLFSVGALVYLPTRASAATDANCQKESAGFLGFPTWYKFLEPQYVPADPNANPPRSEECKLTFPRDGDGKESVALALPRILLAVFEIILRVSGLAAVGFVIYGGIQYILSQGEPEKTKASKNTIVNALIGLVVAMMASAIVNLIGNSIT